MAAELVLPGKTLSFTGVDTLKRGILCLTWPNNTTPLPFKKNPVLDPSFQTPDTLTPINLPMEFVEMNGSGSEISVYLGLMHAADLVLGQGKNVNLSVQVREMMGNGVKSLQRNRSSWMIDTQPFPFQVLESKEELIVRPVNIPDGTWTGSRKAAIADVLIDALPIHQIRLPKNRPGQRSFMKLSAPDAHFNYEFELDPEVGLRYTYLGFVPTASNQIHA